VKAYLGNYVPAASTGITSIPDLITSGKVKRAEVVVEPQLAVGTQTVALNAPSKTVDMANGSFVANYFQGTNAIVSEAKCNACHDALATTFHTSSAAGEVGAGNRGGNIVVCRTCHVTTSGGSHLEMQSRGIASYIHSIHSFQAFDLQYNPARDSGVNFDDPVEAKRYSLHVTHVFPNFTIRNCEGCHNEGKYNVPDQSKSMPGLLSASSEPNGWYEYDEDFGYITNLPDGERNIGNVPSYVTGPASMACGGCHRANYISEDRAGDLVAFNQHVANGGYLVDPAEQDPDEEVDLLYQAIDKIMSLFE
jgi:OmcA/MtrC family decaheme c-type cytochrome